MYKDFSFVLKLDKEKIKGVKSIRKVPGIETIVTRSDGKLFSIKYYRSMKN